MIESEHIRIDCKLTRIIDDIVKKHPLYNTKRKFIELAILEKINRVKKK